ncbi:hypothetical protein FRC01_003293, partial [Tulasnella sp. 417]
KLLGTWVTWKQISMIKAFDAHHPPSCPQLVNNKASQNQRESTSCRIRATKKRKWVEADEEEDEDLQELLDEVNPENWSSNSDVAMEDQECAPQWLTHHKFSHLGFPLLWKTRLRKMRTLDLPHPVVTPSVLGPLKGLSSEHHTRLVAADVLNINCAIPSMKFIESTVATSQAATNALLLHFKNILIDYNDQVLSSPEIVQYRDLCLPQAFD